MACSSQLRDMLWWSHLGGLCCVGHSSEAYAVLVHSLEVYAVLVTAQRLIRWSQLRGISETYWLVTA